jgi:hypothetical protein
MSLPLTTLMELLAAVALSASLLVGLGAFAAARLGRAVSRDDEQREAPGRRPG